MDDYTNQLMLGIGALVVLGVVFFIWKFFFSLIKHVVAALIVAAIASYAYYQYVQPPPPDPNIGKYAYGTNRGDYLGKVVGAAEDPQKGPVWVIESPGGSPAKYSRARVVLKDRLELPSSPKPSPSPSPTPNKPKDKRPRPRQ